MDILLSELNLCKNTNNYKSDGHTNYVDERVDELASAARNEGLMKLVAKSKKIGGKKRIAMATVGKKEKNVENRIFDEVEEFENNKTLGVGTLNSGGLLRGQKENKRHPEYGGDEAKIFFRHL